MHRTIFYSTFSLAALVAGGAMAANPSTLNGKAAFGGWAQDKPGVVRHISEDALPAPDLTKSASNGARVISRPADAVPKVPAGYEAQLVASGIKNPRAIRFAPNGDLFVADSSANQMLVYRVSEGQAKPTAQAVFASGLHRPYGIAFYPPGPDPKWVYIANSNSVVRFPYKAGDLKASGEPQTIIDNIPSNHHWTRSIVFSPDGKTLYLSVGSGSNVAETIPRTPPGGLDKWAASQPLGAIWGSERGRAAVWAYTPEGQDGHIIATGLRNCSGMTVQPATGEPWCVVNERDGLGDNVPFEYATHVAKGAFYGWPWYYIGDHEDPSHKGEWPDLKARVTVPDVLMQAHSAPLGIAFNPSYSRWLFWRLADVA